MSLIYALLLTILSEGILVLLLTRSGKTALQSIYCNLVTNPVVNLIYVSAQPYLAPKAGWILIIVLEILVVLSEMYFYRIMSEKAFLFCLFLSLCANAFSFSLGLFFTI